MSDEHEPEPTAAELAAAFELAKAMGQWSLNEAEQRESMWFYPEPPDIPSPGPGDLLHVIAEDYDGYFIVSGVADGEDPGSVSLGLIGDPENQPLT